jgi:hypothetical protein
VRNHHAVDELRRTVDGWPNIDGPAGGSGLPDRPLAREARSTTVSVMSSDRSDDQPRAMEAFEESTDELPVLVQDEPAPPVVTTVVTGRAMVGWPHSIPLVSPSDATVPIVIPANLLGDEPVERPSLLVMIAVHGTFLAAAIVLVAVLMAIAAK